MDYGVLQMLLTQNSNCVQRKRHVKVSALRVGITKPTADYLGAHLCIKRAFVALCSFKKEVLN